MGEKLFTAKEAAEILKVRKNTVYDMIKRGDLKASKLGKQLRIRQEDLDFYIQYGSQAKVVDSMQTGHNSNIDKAEFEKNNRLCDWFCRCYSSQHEWTENRHELKYYG